MKTFDLNKKKYAFLARRAAAEGCVLLENKDRALPLKKGEKVAVFGRIAYHYYKSGLGSGGLVNTGHVDTIPESLKKSGMVQIDEELEQLCLEWIRRNPYDEGEGWGRVPWSQKEMLVTEEMLERAEAADASLVIIGRTAGEDQDNQNAPGAYLLSAGEEELIRKVCEKSRRTIVVLNTGNILDMSWVKRYHPQAVLYAWQGGQEGGHGAADVLCGIVNPSGGLTDTIAEDIRDYPSSACFGDELENEYREDIYVGYRYFETFAKEKVLYPFGYGLSYTSFTSETELISPGDPVKQPFLTIKGKVQNTGTCPGKEVVQIYVQPPQGKLGSPFRKLAAFYKTKELKSQETEAFTLKIPYGDLASFDDTGETGHLSAFVLEAGSYRIYAGRDVRSACQIGCWEVPELLVTEQLSSACGPVKVFQRIRPSIISGKEGSAAEIAYEAVPLRREDPEERRRKYRPEEIPCTGDKGFRLADVADQKITMEKFIAQLTDRDLCCLFRGEGMCSPKVTAGTAAAFGGVTEELQRYGIPAGCCADGPSGIRMDCGTRAFSLPNGTLLGCSFNLSLVEELYEMLGLELRLNQIDSLLGPGINVHRNPLNGRNFEYISEDPYLTGKMAAAQIRGMDRYGIGSTLKHFCANSQEFSRHRANAVVSERALREIYLKGFEIAVKEGKARSVMTSYGPVNGIWTASCYDLCTVILREEWGFEGIVMTDWWAKGNYEGREGGRECKAPIAAAQNDLYMVTQDAALSLNEDDMCKQLEAGYLTRAELQRNAANILGFLIKSPAFLRLENRISQEETEAGKKQEEGDVQASQIEYLKEETPGSFFISGGRLHPKARHADVFGMQVTRAGWYQIRAVLRSDLGELAQLPITVYLDNIVLCQISIQGTEGQTICVEKDLDHIRENTHYLKLYYGADGIEIESIEIRCREEGGRIL